jgi:hypothetical protein
MTTEEIEACEGYKLSNCCSSSIYENTDICSDCKEHCGTWCEDCDESEHCKNKIII